MDARRSYDMLELSLEQYLTAQHYINCTARTISALPSILKFLLYLILPSR
jgi:hypothetical protein